MLLNGHRTSSPIHVLVARKGYRRTVSYLSSLVIVRTLMACNDMRSNGMRFLFLSDEGPVLETLDHTIRIGSTPTILYFDL